MAMAISKGQLSFVVDAATAGCRSDMGTFGAFLDECCVIEKRASAITAELLAAHKTWAERNSERGMSGRAMGSRSKSATSSLSET